MITFILAGKKLKLKRNDFKISANDVLPISVVKGDGFRELINLIQSDYNIPSRGTAV